MKPSEKDPALEAKLENIFGFNRRAYIQGNRCVPPPIGCGGAASEFRDECSRREFSISGLCQKCQDSVWPAGGDDED